MIIPERRIGLYVVKLRGLVRLSSLRGLLSISIKEFLYYKINKTGRTIDYMRGLV